MQVSSVFVSFVWKNIFASIFQTRAAQYSGTFFGIIYDKQIFKVGSLTTSFENRTFVQARWNISYTWSNPILIIEGKLTFRLSINLVGTYPQELAIYRYLRGVGTSYRICVTICFRQQHCALLRLNLKLLRKSRSQMALVLILYFFKSSHIVFKY